MIGGWGNTRILIRRKKSNDVLTEMEVVNPINNDRPTKIVIEITNSELNRNKVITSLMLLLINWLIYLLIISEGHIRLYTEANVGFPLASAYDPKPIAVKYLSFAAWDNAEVYFYYKCGF